MSYDANNIIEVARSLAGDLAYDRYPKEYTDNVFEACRFLAFVQQNQPDLLPIVRPMIMDAADTENLLIVIVANEQQYGNVPSYPAGFFTGEMRGKINTYGNRGRHWGVASLDLGWRRPDQLCFPTPLALGVEHAEVFAAKIVEDIFTYAASNLISDILLPGNYGLLNDAIEAAVRLSPFRLIEMSHVSIHTDGTLSYQRVIEEPDHDPRWPKSTDGKYYQKDKAPFAPPLKAPKGDLASKVPREEKDLVYEYIKNMTRTIYRTVWRENPTEEARERLKRVAGKVFTPDMLAEMYLTALDMVDRSARPRRRRGTP